MCLSFHLHYHDELCLSRLERGLGKDYAIYRTILTVVSVSCECHRPNRNRRKSEKIRRNSRRKQTPVKIRSSSTSSFIMSPVHTYLTQFPPLGPFHIFGRRLQSTLSLIKSANTSHVPLDSLSSEFAFTNEPETLILPFSILVPLTKILAVVPSDAWNTLSRREDFQKESFYGLKIWQMLVFL